jgi:hypothetical protein
VEKVSSLLALESGTVGERAHRHIFYGLFQSCAAGGVLYVHRFGISGNAVAEPPIVLRRRTDGNSPPLVRNRICQKAIVGLFGDRWAGEANNFRRPGERKSVSGKLHDIQLLRLRQSIERDEVGKLLDGSRRVIRREALMGRLEEDVQIQARLVALMLLKNSGHDGARKAWLFRDESEGLGGQDAGVRLVRCGVIDCAHFAAANHQHVRGQSHVDGGRETVQSEAANRKPTSGIKQITGVVPDVGQA